MGKEDFSENIKMTQSDVIQLSFDVSFSLLSVSRWEFPLALGKCLSLDYK